MPGIELDELDPVPHEDKRMAVVAAMIAISCSFICLFGFGLGDQEVRTQR